jgi:sugar phosphate isomerase/epimerase
MKLGIGTYTFTWAVGVPGRLPPKPMTPIELLEQARELGVRVVQFCDNLPLVKLSPAELDAFHERVLHHGFEIELGTRGLDHGNLRANLALARRFRCSFLRLVIDSHGDEPSAEDTVRRLSQILPEFAVAGVKLAIENHDRFKCATLAWIIEKLGTNRAGICLDTVNSFGALEGPEQVVDILGRYTLCLHVKDFTIRRPAHAMGFLVEGCAAGRGRLDVPWLLRQLTPRANSFNAILETWVTPSDSLEETIARERAWAEEGICYLRPLIT